MEDGRLLPITLGGDREQDLSRCSYNSAVRNWKSRIAAENTRRSQGTSYPVYRAVYAEQESAGVDAENARRRQETSCLLRFSHNSQVVGRRV